MGNECSKITMSNNKDSGDENDNGDEFKRIISNVYYFIYFQFTFLSELVYYNESQVIVLVNSSYRVDDSVKRVNIQACKTIKDFFVYVSWAKD